MPRCWICLVVGVVTPEIFNRCFPALRRFKAIGWKAGLYRFSTSNFFIIMQRLKEAKWDVTISQVKKDFEDCCRKYFSEYPNKIPPCSFFIKGHASRAGYFLCTYEGETSENHQIVINRDVVSNREGLRSVVYHETIHFWQSILYSRFQYKHMTNGGHDAFFRKKMEEMNQIEGAGFISVLYPRNQLTTTATFFYAYVLKTLQGEWVACYTGRLDQKLIETFQRLLKTGNYLDAMWFKTNNYNYLTKKKPSNNRLKLTFLENDDFLTDPTLDRIPIF